MTATEQPVTPTGANKPQSKHHFDVLRYLKTIQSQHGISEEQHIRYRQYCTRRLHRVRTCDDVKLGIKGGAKYKKQELTADLMKTPKHLTIPLLEAERAWAYALEERTNLDEPLEGNDGKKDKDLRRHIITRLRRATQHATEFDELCKATADQHTQLQAHVYKSWIFSLYYIESEDWVNALKNLNIGKEILETFISTLHNQSALHICNERLTKVTLYINFCNQRLKKAGTDVSTLDLATAQDPTLVAKLERVKTSSLKKKNAAAAAAATAAANNDSQENNTTVAKDSVVVGNNTFKITHPKVKTIYQQAKSLYASYIQTITAQQGDNNANFDAKALQKVQTSNKRKRVRVKTNGDVSSNNTTAETNNNNNLTNITTQLQSYYDNIIIILNQELKDVEAALTKAKTTQNDEQHRNVLGLITYFNLAKYETVFYRHVLTFYDLLTKYDGDNTKIQLKTVLIMLERLITIIKQGIELFNNTTNNNNTTSAAAGLTNYCIEQLNKFNKFINIVQLYYTLLFQHQQLTTTDDNTTTTSDNKTPFEKCQDLNTLMQYNTQQFKTLQEELEKIKNNNNNTNFGTQFAFITTLFQTQQYASTLTSKITQLQQFAIKLKVVYYQYQYAASSGKNTTAASGTIPINNNLQNTNIFKRLDSFEIGPQTQQYNVTNILPQLQQIPVKPFVFDTAYGHIVADHEYNTAAQQEKAAAAAAPVQTQAPRQQQPTTAAAEAPEQTAEEEPKSFWSRLWG